MDENGSDLGDRDRPTETGGTGPDFEAQFQQARRARYQGHPDHWLPPHPDRVATTTTTGPDQGIHPTNGQVQQGQAHARGSRRGALSALAVLVIAAIVVGVALVLVLTHSHPTPAPTGSAAATNSAAAGADGADGAEGQLPCPHQQQQDGTVITRRPGGKSDAISAIEWFEYSYYVARDGQRAWEVVAPDTTQVSPPGQIQLGINSVPAGTQYCLRISPMDGSSTDYYVEVTEHQPAFTAQLFPMHITVAMIDGAARITSITKAGN